MLAARFPGMAVSLMLLATGCGSVSRNRLEGEAPNTDTVSVVIIEKVREALQNNGNDQDGT